MVLCPGTGSWDDQMGGACGMYVGRIWVLVGKPESKEPYERPKCRREHKIKMDLK